MGVHHYELRGWPVAIGLGAILTFVVVVRFLTNGFGAYAASGNLSAEDNGGPTWVNGRLTPHGWFEALWFASITAAAGAVVGFVVWRTAYRRVGLEHNQACHHLGAVGRLTPETSRCSP